MFQTFKLFNQNLNEEQTQTKKQNQQTPTRFSYLYDQAMQQTQKKKQFEKEILAQKNQEIQDQCTFNPKVNSKYNGNINNTDFISRNENWLQARGMKIQNYKNYLEQLKYQECSFKPQTNYGVCNDNQFQKEIYMNRGTANYLMRQISARKQKEKDTKQKKRQTFHTTVPQEFNITKNQEKIKQIKIQNFIFFDQKKQSTQDLTDQQFQNAQLQYRQLLKNIEF